MKRFQLWLTVSLLTKFETGSGVSLKQSSRAPQMNNHQNISSLLDNLLRGYDNSVRPDFGGPPAVVEVDIMVRSMGPISEVDMTYSMDCYFRQSWVDRRLAFPGDTNDTLALSISMLARIWKPDTYFYNGKQSYLHTITTPNKFVRLYQDGRVLYSSRLTIKAGCPMNLEDFPMDIQRCPLKFGSFGYTAQDVLYRWNAARQVAIAEDMKLSQFDLIATPAANHTDTIVNSDTKSGVRIDGNFDFTEYSMLLVSFHLQRHMGNFLIQVYGPCVLLVVLSWVSFWLNREATADRVSLGITTVLTMTFLGLEARTDLPKVPYPTALDFFVFLSFSFIFATIIQFAVVHYFTKYGSGECYFSSDFSSDSSSDEEDWIESRENAPKEVSHSPVCKSSNYGSSNGGDPHFIEVIPLSACSIPVASMRRTSQPWSNLSCINRSQDDKNYHASPNKSTGSQKSPCQSQKHRKKKKKRTPRFNSVSKIDRASRVVFPVLFVTINLFYWYSYLSRTKRIVNLNVS
ncbi:GABA-gated ion channel isoform X1 [Tribolium castaneum]|uniref:GABA-gated ion channel isoform X1 n=1 Tax=Tribolium castaneum TaxID=7070 RepID=UPI00077DAD86|nr:PREDICTED: GABA-gated ion channel isoform X2 [Tribolium castaneum]|eukprot:XP_015834304.1 PREDICTED: GABA-gated ion channel isoform X2 [Tribolium castaneum]